MASSRVNVILPAVATSIAVHLVLMAVMRPQVMTYITSADASRSGRMPMQIDEPISEPDSIHIDVLQDINSKQDTPLAEIEESILPSNGAELGAVAAAYSEEVKKAESLEPVSVPKLTSTPSEFLSRPISDGATVDVSPSISPISTKENLNKIAVIDTEVSALPKIDFAEDPLPLKVSSMCTGGGVAPMPVVAPKLGAPASATGKVVFDKVQVQKPTPYEPIKEVMAEINKEVVAKEKEAVKALLDIQDAKELKDFVKIKGYSAMSDNWIYFRVCVMPCDELKTVPKDVVIMVDGSGSIGNDRLRSCRVNAKKILRSCMNTGDRFNLVVFRNDFSYAFKTWQECTDRSFKSAEAWIDKETAHGTTDVFSTVESVLKLPRDPKRPLIALVVTDGIANVGISKTEQILSRFSKLNDGLISVYMYGVQDRANRPLIDLLTHGNRGESFIYEGEERRYAGRSIEMLSNRFRDPVLSDLRVVFSADSKAETYPRLLKNIYRNDMVEIVGRVPSTAKEIAFSLKGLNGANAHEGFFRFKLSDFKFDKNTPALWKNEKIIDAKIIGEKSL